LNLRIAHSLSLVGPLRRDQQRLGLANPPAPRLCVKPDNLTRAEEVSRWPQPDACLLVLLTFWN